MVDDAVVQVEPPVWSFVVAGIPESSDRTIWENDRGDWFCLCCDGRARWDQLVDPVDTLPPADYVNDAWPDGVWPLQ